MNTKQRSEITPVEVANPYCLKLRYTYSKCEECKSILPYPNLRLLNIIKKEKITTNQRIWDTFGCVNCEECAYLLQHKSTLIFQLKILGLVKYHK